MQSDKTLIIILVSAFVLAAAGLLIWLSRDGDETTGERTAHAPAGEQSADAEETEAAAGGGEAGETEETGTEGGATGTDGNASALAMRAREILDGIVASNDRLEPLVAECDLEAIGEETKTLSERTAAALEFVRENSGDPAALAELADFPDQVNAQADRSETILTKSAGCRSETT